MENVGIYSFCTDNLVPYKTFQKMVFDKLNIPIYQLPKYISEYNDPKHQAGTFKPIIESTDHDFYIFFDIDCIPLNVYFYEKIVNKIKDGNTLAGAIQTANHLPNPINSYVSQAFMGISREVFYKIGCPNGISDFNHDEFQSYTELCIKNEINIEYWMPTKVEIPMWKLYKNSIHIGEFGIGTTYENMIYHNFASRDGSYFDYFVDKCKEVIYS